MSDEVPLEVKTAGQTKGRVYYEAINARRTMFCEWNRYRMDLLNTRFRGPDKF